MFYFLFPLFNQVNLVEIWISFPTEKSFHKEIFLLLKWIKASDLLVSLFSRCCVLNLPPARGTIEVLFHICSRHQSLVEGLSNKWLKQIYFLYLRRRCRRPALPWSSFLHRGTFLSCQDCMQHHSVPSDQINTRLDQCFHPDWFISSFCSHSANLSSLFIMQRRKSHFISAETSEVFSPHAASCWSSWSHQAGGQQGAALVSAGWNTRHAAKSFLIQNINAELTKAVTRRLGGCWPGTTTERGNAPTWEPLEGPHSSQVGLTWEPL